MKTTAWWLCIALLACDGASDAGIAADAASGDVRAEVLPGPADDPYADATPSDEVDAPPSDEVDATPSDAIDATPTEEVDAAPSDDAEPSDPLAACMGRSAPLAFARQLPYAMVGVGGAEGAFLVDWGTTGSAIDPTGFEPFWPSPVAGTSDRWAGFEFFGPWSEVVLSVQDFSAFADPFRQAGILGTDFLALNVFLVDWREGRLARAEAGAGCSAETLIAAGFSALSSEGYYASDFGRLLPGVPNIPTIPVRVGASRAPAQIDTGYDDSLLGPAANINRAFHDTIAPGALVRDATSDLVLTTCVPGVFESVTAYRLADGEALELVAEDGSGARRFPDAILFLKQTPDAAWRCGGIGTWSTPAAQLGVSFMARAGRVVFDPEQSRVWVPAER